MKAAPVLAWVGGLATAMLASSAEAAVRGRRGLEIEGPQDRRGFYIGGGANVGGTFFALDDFVPALRLDFVLGGGVSKRFTLGADLHVTPYLAAETGAAFGGDIEATGYLWRGLYLRGAAGVAGVPERRAPPREGYEIHTGLGGAAGAGYEMFLNNDAALGVGLTYDARYVPQLGGARQTLLAGLRFTWY